MNIGNVVFRCLLCGLPLSAALNFARGKECGVYVLALKV